MSEQTIPQSTAKPINPLAGYFRQPKLYLKLPSNGEFYPDGTLDHSQIDEYAVFAMTAKDELIFKSPDALMNGQATVEVIKSCVPAIKDPWLMPSIDLDAVLIAIRIATYGDEMEVTSICPSCNHSNDYHINLIHYLDHAAQFQYVKEIAVDPLIINIRPYNYKEITKTAIRSLEQQKIISIVNDETMSDEEKIERFGASFVKLTELTVDVVTGCITSIQTPTDLVTDQEQIKEFVNNCPTAVFNGINEHIGKLKNDIALKAQTVSCQECEITFDVELTMDQTKLFVVGS
jgi:hypothetical protein